MATYEIDAHVPVHDADRGTFWFKPGDAVPDWALPHLSNPKVWKDGKVPPGAQAPERASRTIAPTHSPQPVDGPVDNGGDSITLESTAAAVEAWVAAGDDPKSRAQEALDMERSPEGKQRSTLIIKLQKIANS